MMARERCGLLRAAGCPPRVLELAPKVAYIRALVLAAEVLAPSSRRMIVVIGAISAANDSEMGDGVSAQTSPERVLIESLDGEFARLHARLWNFVLDASPDQLESSRKKVLRSAATLERTFGGITANMWDDPFEWTLPETLSSREKIIEYLTEVENLRRQAFARIREDSELFRVIALPSEQTSSLLVVLLETLVNARSLNYRP